MFLESVIHWKPVCKILISLKWQTLQIQHPNLNIDIKIKWNFFCNNVGCFSIQFSFRFALKRHRNIHEKYGRTKANTSSATQSTKEETTNTDNNSNATINQDGGIQQEQIEIEDTKYEHQPKYEDTDAGVEITEEMTEITELQVQLS